MGVALRGIASLIVGKGDQSFRVEPSSGRDRVGPEMGSKFERNDGITLA